MTFDHPTPETVVPPGEAPPARCPYCDRPFRTEHRRDLHLGDAHADGLSPAERERHEAAREAEADELFGYHAKVVMTLGGLYSVLVILYMVAFGTGFL